MQQTIRRLDSTGGLGDRDDEHSDKGFDLMKRFSGYGVACSLLLLVVLPIAVPAVGPLEIPPGLEGWRSWVLKGHEEALCPTDYDNGAAARCQWPSRLHLEVDDNGGTFEQRWLAFADGWAALPGNRSHWPDSVSVDGRSAAVIDRSGIPMVRLEPGEHRIMGRFSWGKMPEMIRVPPALGLLDLIVEGRRVRIIVVDEQGRLWLEEGQEGERGEDRLGVQVFRLIDDTIPMQVTTHLKIDVSGTPREIVLGGVLPAGGTPMAIKSPLPARLDADGGLNVQARAGQWELAVVARMSGPQHKIGAGNCPHGDEIWSFRPRHDLRMVEVLDVPPLEPSRTEMPAAWHRYPAYLIKAGSVMTLKEIRRGDPDPAPDQLSLNRTWWLDFDGAGFTLHDVVGGTLSRQWALAVNAPMVLGRVAVDGRERVITEQGPEKKMGVELRRGRLSLVADARVTDRSSAMPAVGWDHDFQSVAGVLNLPPGWRLLAVSGADKVSDAWLQRWSLLDFFLILIIALAVSRLRSWAWGLVALATMVVIWHEPGAPRLVWLHLLAVLALLPLLPVGWFRRLVAVWGIAAVAVLLMVAVPFVVQQIRWGLYPQLAPAGDVATPVGAGLAPTSKNARVSDASAGKDKALTSDRSMLSLSAAAEEKAPVLGGHDPEALIPTGPGLPDWRWRSVRLGWSGPVAKEQPIRFYLLSPGGNLLLALARVALLIGLTWGVIGRKAWWQPYWQRMRERFGPAAVVVLVVLSAAILRPDLGMAEAAGYPPTDLLDELRQRLLEQPDCLPHCADIARMELTASGDDVQVLIKIHCAERMAVPLPFNRKSWIPDQILLDNAPISGLRIADDGQLWALVPAGVHTVALTGDVGQTAAIQMPLPLRPHNVSYRIDGWRLDGIDPDGGTGASIQLTRLSSDRASSEKRHADSLPPFLKVERVLRLGLSWKVATTVTRLTPPGTPVVASIPLIENESVTTAGIQVDQGRVLINMAPSQRVAAFESVLKIASPIRLTAPKAVPWTESWVLDAAAIWHCDIEGIAAVHHRDVSGQWRPRWRPWPGEQVTIRVNRPAAVAGRTKTIDRAAMTLTPGRRFGRGELDLHLRASRGDQHTVTLPPKANLQQVTVNGKSLPVRQDGSYVTVPLQPGSQRIAVQWRHLAPLATFFQVPEVQIGQAAANAKVRVTVPPYRWIIMVGGPRWGPAVLFWSYAVAIVLLSLVLGRLPLSPLKRWQWLLLLLGLTQIPTAMAMLVVGWIVIMGVRSNVTMPGHWLPFNGIQIGLVLWTLAALVALFIAVKAGLVGQPEMQIAGNLSSHTLLNWTQDRIEETMPRPWMITLPVWVFHLLMLAWSLWLAWSLLGWLKWTWQCLNTDGGWRKITLRRRVDAPAE